MKNGRCLIEKIIFSLTKLICVFIGIIFLTGFYNPGSNYIKLDDITIELGEKIPEDKINYINSYLLNSDFILENNVPKDLDGHTTKAGVFNYYVVHRDEERKYSKLTNNNATISVIDTVKPEIRINNNSLKFDYGSVIKINDIADCYDLASCDISLKNSVNTYKEGKQDITIIAIDESGNINETTINITIKNKPMYYSPSYRLMDEHNKLLNNGRTEDEKNSIRAQMVAFAKQFVGNPYVYGGNSLTNGIDCSAFTKAIYSRHGYQLPRSAFGQGYVGIPITRSELLPGDLILYHNNGVAYHVTMYIGNNMVIHASNPRDGIKINNIWSDARFYRRIIY